MIEKNIIFKHESKRNFAALFGLVLALQEHASQRTDCMGKELRWRRTNS